MSQLDRCEGWANILWELPCTTSAQVLRRLSTLHELATLGSYPAGALLVEMESGAANGSVAGVVGAIAGGMRTTFSKSWGVDASTSLPCLMTEDGVAIQSSSLAESITVGLALEGSVIPLPWPCMILDSRVFANEIQVIGGDLAQFESRKLVTESPAVEVHGRAATVHKSVAWAVTSPFKITIPRTTMIMEAYSPPKVSDLDGIRRRIQLGDKLAEKELAAVERRSTEPAHSLPS